MLDMVEGDISKITARTVAVAARQNDPLALDIFEGVAHALAAGVASIVNGLNPSCVILGGGVMEGAPFLLSKIEAGVRVRALKTATRPLQIVEAALKNEAGIVGAASYLLNRG
jgi:glucokinase